MDPQHHLQRNRRTASFAGGLVTHGLNQGQKCFPGNRGLQLIQEALATRPLFGVDLLVVREAQLEGSAIRSSLSPRTRLISAGFPGVPQGKLEMNLLRLV